MAFKLCFQLQLAPLHSASPKAAFGEEETKVKKKKEKKKEAESGCCVVQ
jgi:hypothetical protein